MEIFKKDLSQFAQLKLAANLQRVKLHTAVVF